MPLWIGLVPLLLGAAPQQGTTAQIAQRIYFRRAGSLMVYDLAKQSPATLWPQRSPDDDDAPAVSRDGRTVFFSQGGNLWALTTGQSAPRRLTTLGRPGVDAVVPPRCDRPLPSPDGRWLAYRCVADDGSAQLRMADLTTGHDEALADIDGFEVCWSPEGGLVYVADGKLWQRNPPDSMPRPLLPELVSHGVQSAPHYAADGRLLFTCDGQPMVRWTDGNVAPAVPLGLAASRAWSTPDSGCVALERWLSDPRDSARRWAELSVVDPADGKARVLVSTYAATGHGGRATPLGWLDRDRLLVLRDLYENCRKVYAVNLRTARSELVLKGQDRDAGFAVWPN